MNLPVCSPDVIRSVGYFILNNENGFDDIANELREYNPDLLDMVSSVAEAARGSESGLDAQSLVMGMLGMWSMLKEQALSDALSNNITGED